VGGIAHTVATEMAFAFRFTAQRLYDVGFLNRVVTEDQLMPTAHEMALHLLSLPPASRVNTLTMMRAMRPRVSDELTDLAERLREHGAKDDLMESRRAFAEKRAPQFKGWNDPEDRYRTPTLESIRRERTGDD
jgi:enoyl-CoA hydratase/carnithine racemase